jgi:hypothetical protein
MRCAVRHRIEGDRRRGRAEGGVRFELGEARRIAVSPSTDRVSLSPRRGVVDLCSPHGVTGVLLAP